VAPTNRLRSLLFGALASLAIGAVPAYSQKTGYVASEEILSRMTEVTEGRTRLAEMQSTWMREIQTQEGEISRQRADIETNRLLWSSQERREAEGKLKDLEQKLAQFRASKYDSGGEYEKLHNEILAPLYEKVFTAINDEAKAQKYDFVFDKSSRGMPMLFANPEYDLTAAVLTRLGVKIDPAELEGGKTETTDGRSPRRGRRDPDPGTEDPNDALKEKPVETEDGSSK
jgi:outer membrane protein